MTVKYGIYFNFSCQKRGGENPPCGAEWGGVRTPSPLAETLIANIGLSHIYAHNNQKFGHDLRPPFFFHEVVMEEEKF